MSLVGNYICKLSEKVERKTVTYDNRYGLKVTADLYVMKGINKTKRFSIFEL